MSWLNAGRAPEETRTEGLSVDPGPEGPTFNGEPLFREMERIVREVRVQVTPENIGAVAAHFGWLVDYSPADGHRPDHDPPPRLRKPDDTRPHARIGDWLREDGRKVYDRESGSGWVRAGTWVKREGVL